LQAADQRASLQVFDEMVSQGMKPTPQCYTSLLAACSRAGDLTAARRVFRTMHVDRNVAAYTALMDACLKNGTPAALDEAFEASNLYEICPPFDVVLTVQCWSAGFTDVRKSCLWLCLYDCTMIVT